MSHKVLVVDDDPFIRKILQNLLAKFDCEVVEACNGIEALALVESAHPDLVLLDIGMPVLGGLETLEEIRASGPHCHLPVVAVSSHTERHLVMRLVDLGILGFLMKPLRPSEALRRLERIFEQIRQGSTQLHAAAGSPARRAQRLLLVDRDPNFRQFLRPLLESRYEVLEAGTGVAGLQLYLQHEPETVLVGDDLHLLGTERLVQIVRESRASTVPRIYLITGAEAAAAPTIAGVDGVMRRSFIPDLFVQELRPLFDSGGAPAAALRAFVRDRLREELITAAQQSIGVLMARDAAALPAEQLPEIGRGVCIRAVLALVDESASVVVEFLSSVEEVERFGSRILGAPVEMQSGAADAALELVNTIAGRIRASLSESGVRLEPTSPEIVTDGGADATGRWDLALPFATTDGDRFVLAVSVHERSDRSEPKAAA